MLFNKDVSYFKNNMLDNKYAWQVYLFLYPTKIVFFFFNFLPDQVSCETMGRFFRATDANVDEQNRSKVSLIKKNNMEQLQILSYHIKTILIALFITLFLILIHEESNSISFGLDTTCHKTATEKKQLVIWQAQK